jgi:hypothetical protein
VRHLHITRNKMVHSGQGALRLRHGRARLFDGVEIVEAARGISH